MQKKVEFYVGNQKLVGDLHFSPPPRNGSRVSTEAGGDSLPCVIVSHGFGSNRKKGKGPQIAEMFSSEGIAVFNFDHRGALEGESDGKFEDTTLTRRVEDLKGAIDSLTRFEKIDSNRIGLIGSSLGGRTVLALPKDEKIKAIALLAAPIFFAIFPIWIRKSLDEKGYYETPNGIRVKKEFYVDFENHDFEEEAKMVSCPMLIIHGQYDEQIPCEQAEVLYESAGSQIKEIQIIKKANHGFTDQDKSKEVLDLSLTWFKKYL
jgi:esterase/lipase